MPVATPIHRVTGTAAALTLCLQATCQNEVPTFVDGDRNAVTCRVVKVTGKSDWVRFLEIEVHNTCKVGCEPLAFEIRLKAKKRKQPARTERFERTKRPRAQRFGRPTLPGKKQRYFLATSLVGDRGKYDVRVVNASFHDGDVVPQPQLIDGKLDQVQSSSLAGTFPITRVPLRNPFDRDIDAIFRVTLKQPTDATELFGVRIPKGAALDWDLYSRPGAIVYLHPDPAPGSALKATKLELVDWVLAAPPDVAAAKAKFVEAYRRWHTWPDDKPIVRGEFTHVVKEKRANGKDYVETTATGKFTVAADGTVDVAGDDKTSADYALERAFADVHRKSVDKVLAENRFLFIDANSIEVQGPGVQSRPSNHTNVAGGKSQGSGNSWWYAVDGTRLVGRGWGEGKPSAWQTRELGNGYVVTQKEVDSATVESFDYRRTAGLIAPARWTSTKSYNGVLHRSEELRIDKLTIAKGAVAQSSAPTGDGAAQLRAVWDAAPRVTQEAITVTANIEVRTPATDGVWHGRKKITGKLTMRGIGRNCSHLELQLGRSYSPEVERGLASAVYDRFLLWFGKDLNDRLPFDDYFSGARIDKPTAGGVYRVHDGPVIAVRVQKGRITYLELEKGQRREFFYQKGDDGFVQRFKLGKAETHVTLTEVNGHVLPSKLHFKKCFGPTWGPETIMLRNIKVAPAK